MDRHIHKSKRRHKSRNKEERLPENTKIVDVKEQECNLECNEVCNIEQVQEVQEEVQDDAQEEKKEEKLIHVNHIEKKSTVKIPVVLVSKKIDILVESIVAFDEPIMKVRYLNENVFLTEAKLIPTDNVWKAGRGILFLKGFIEKSGEYNVMDCVTDDYVSGENKNLLINIPFECSTTIEFSHVPFVGDCNSEITLEIKRNVHEKDNDVCIQVQGGSKELIELEQKEMFFEPIYCELDGAEIFQKDIYTDTKSLESGLPFMTFFQTIREELVIMLDVKLSQKQNMSIAHKKRL